MGYEIDVLPVGSGECSGDAIALRFGNLFGKRSEQAVVVIDGGYRDTGKRLVKHIATHYKTDIVDLVISTHPDNDHSSGLIPLLETMKVGTLWMHRPWDHTDDIARLFRDGRVSDRSVGEALRKSLDSARTLERIAGRRGIRIAEPFTGTAAWGAEVQVVGPTTDFYESLLSDFRCTPLPRVRGLTSFGSIVAALSEGALAVVESWGKETLTDAGETSAENNSSVILLVQPQSERSLLFTSDAGIPALTLAADVLSYVDFDFDSIKFIQVPHHGSRRNVGPTVLNRFLGAVKSEDRKLRTAYVSASRDGAPKHPSRRVTNAFRRRGAWVYGTMTGNVTHHSHDAPARGWPAIEPVPMYRKVEAAEEEVVA